MMSTQDQILADIKPVSEVLGTGHFEVPWHQRYYDWGASHVDDLLKDLYGAMKDGRTSYFLGSIMLAHQGSGSALCINDGQQRLITLSLILASLCDQFVNHHRPRDWQRESEILKLLFRVSPSQRVSMEDVSNLKPRITPPSSDIGKYRHMIRGEPLGTNGKLMNAQKDIAHFVTNMEKPEREQFHVFILNNVKLAVLTIPETEDAEAIFEALNARGKPLSSVDLIRNRLYSYFSEPSERQRRQEVHGALEETITVLRKGNKMEPYFQCFLQCEYGPISKTRLYADFRRAITSQTTKKNPVQYVYELIQRLTQKDAVELFRTLSSLAPLPEAFERLRRPRGVRPLDICLQELQQYSVSHSILFSLLVRVMRARPGKPRQDTWTVAVKSIANLASFVMRTSFLSTKFEPSHFDAPFAECAKRIMNGRGLASLDIASTLLNNDELEVLDDQIFTRKLLEIRFTNSKKARTFLFGINASMQRGRDALRFERCTLEHILPKSDEYWPSWEQFTQSQAKESYQQSGNLTLLTKDEATGARSVNKSFESKKSLYKKSPFHITSTISRRTWNQRAIQERSILLASSAASTWKFNGEVARTKRGQKTHSPSSSSKQRKR